MKAGGRAFYIDIISQITTERVCPVEQMILA
jgi:hypothetical protein